MNELLQVLIILPSVLAIVAIMFAVMSLCFYGLPAKEEELDAFFEKNLDSYKSNRVSPGMLYGGLTMPYIATMPMSFVAKWYIADSTSKQNWTIPRWSKWTKVLNEIESEYVKNVSKSLTDY